MKKLYIVIVLIATLFNFCGGPKPKTEPVKQPITQTSTEKNQSPDSPNVSDSNLQTNQVTDNETIPPDEEEPQKTTITAEDGRKFHPELIEVQTVKEESLPLIIPEKKEILPNSAEINGIKDVMEGINSGITNIFREFGYAGNIEVPENFRKRVAYYIHYFTHNENGSQFYLRGISRGSQYLPMIKQILKEKRLPPSLAYLPLIESGFSPTARSRAGAVGMWQFMRGTARMYGLKITHQKDERKDPVKSTSAAAEYLNDLLAMFGAEDPFLGICAFNAGEGKILSALRKISYTERSFWTLVKKNLLHNETNEYIPQFLAVILMAIHPEKYAAIPKQMPVDSGETKTEEEEDRELISELHHSDSKDNLGEENTLTTAPAIDQSSPSNSLISDINQNQIDRAEPQTYKVNPGDTLYSIAKRFNTDANAIKGRNNLNSNNIYPGQLLKINSTGITTNSISLKPSSKKYKLFYTVNKKDTLVQIALLFKGVSVRDIMKWNKLKRSRIYPKQKLLLYIAETPRKIVNYTVKKGDNAFRIARKYNTRVEYILSLNGLLSNSPLQPGQQLKIYCF